MPPCGPAFCCGWCRAREPPSGNSPLSKAKAPHSSTSTPTVFFQGVLSAVTSIAFNLHGKRNFAGGRGDLPPSGTFLLAPFQPGCPLYSTGKLAPRGPSHIAPKCFCQQGEASQFICNDPSTKSPPPDCRTISH